MLSHAFLLLVSESRLDVDGWMMMTAAAAVAVVVDLVSCRRRRRQCSTFRTTTVPGAEPLPLEATFGAPRLQGQAPAAAATTLRAVWRPRHPTS